MLEPIKAGDDLFPWDVATIDGEEVVLGMKPDWSDEKAIELGIRTIDYLLQFEENIGSAVMIDMIACGAARARSKGTERQNMRFDELLVLSRAWQGALRGEHPTAAASI